MTPDTAEAILAAINEDAARIARMIGDTFEASSRPISADEKADLAESLGNETRVVSAALEYHRARLGALRSIDDDTAKAIVAAVQEFAAQAARLAVVARDFGQGALMEGRS